MNPLVTVGRWACWRCGASCDLALLPRGGPCDLHLAPAWHPTVRVLAVALVLANWALPDRQPRADGRSRPSLILSPHGQPSHPDVSVVVPLYNEAGQRRRPPPGARREPRAPGPTLRDPPRRRRVARRHPEALLELEARDPACARSCLRRNFGQTAAFSAGFDHARGDVVVTSDGDLQNDPADIPALAGEARRGLRRRVRVAAAAPGPPVEARPVVVRQPPHLAGPPACASTTTAARSRPCGPKWCAGMRLYGEMHRFIPAVASWMGVRLAEVPVNHRPRTRGHEQVRPRAHRARRSSTSSRSSSCSPTARGRRISSASWA